MYGLQQFRLVRMTEVEEQMAVTVFENSNYSLCIISCQACAVYREGYHKRTHLLLGRVSLHSECLLLYCVHNMLDASSDHNAYLGAPTNQTADGG